jgi:hypothetical protein
VTGKFMGVADGGEAATNCRRLSTTTRFGREICGDELGSGWKGRDALGVAPGAEKCEIRAVSSTGSGCLFGPGVICRSLKLGLKRCR